MKKIVSDILKKHNEKFHKDNEVQLVVTKATMRQYLYFKGIMICIMAFFVYIICLKLIGPLYLLVTTASPEKVDTAALADLLAGAVVVLFMMYHFLMLICESFKYGPSNEDMKRLSNTLEDEKRKHDHDLAIIDEAYMLFREPETYKYPQYVPKDDDYEGPKKVMISKDHTMSYEGGFNGNVLVLSSDEEKLEKWANANILLGANSLILCKDSSKHEGVCKIMEEKGYSVHIVKVEDEESDSEGLFKALLSEKKQIVVADVSKIATVSAGFLQLFLKVEEQLDCGLHEHIHVYLEDDMVMDWIRLPNNDSWIDDMTIVSRPHNISYRILISNIDPHRRILWDMRRRFVAAIVLGKGDDDIWHYFMDYTMKKKDYKDYITNNKAYVFTGKGLFEGEVL